MGSRAFPNLKMVSDFVNSLPDGSVVISGGAMGVDSIAAITAKNKGLEVVEHLPDLSGCKHNWEFTNRYYARNRRIVDDADCIVAFTDNTTGGTWSTIKYARSSKKPYVVHKSTGQALPAQPQQKTIAPQNISATKREPGPYHIKRAGIGTFAIHLKRSFSNEQWQNIVKDKSGMPEYLAQAMQMDFYSFLTRDGGHGYIDYLTMPPRSIRNLDKPHIVDIALKALSPELKIPYIQCFQPWNKPRRGVHIEAQKIKLLPGIESTVKGKVIFCCDDISTTNQTISLAVSSIKSAGAHVHGLIWITF